ncbi:MAG TPA: bifunctional riboflavin kinase/FAD synthetase [Burkholderiaceae bacterium]|nr:bifunctional riboflavin kinase/FAD synthetase [Burkholderiaceae bacterium]
MQVLRGIPPARHRAPCVLTIGNFDGVHRGHQSLLARVVADARALGVVPALMTFEPHPREFFAPQRAPARISNLRDKIEALAACGIERVFVQHFGQRLAALEADRFIDEVLVGGCAARRVVVGGDFRFGARRAGDVELLRRRGASGGGFDVAEIETVSDGGERISSSAVREALLAGDLPRASRLIGRPYVVSGRVLHGAKLGRQIGFPTLNLRIGARRPATQGIFAVRVHGVAPRAMAGVASVGVRPTVDDSGRWLLEVHVFDFARDIYGDLVRIEFASRLRDEEKYATIDELTAAIRRDAQRARAELARAGAPGDTR